MSNITHKWNGQIINPPRNWRDLTIEKDFEGSHEPATVNDMNLDFAGEIAKKIRSRIMNGMSGGVGIFEGDDYEIIVGDPNNPAYKFEGFLDYASGVEFESCNEVSVPMKKKTGDDWLNDVADSFSFRYLEDKGIITSADYISVPYIINFRPDGMQLLLLGISAYMITKEIAEAIRSIADLIALTVNAATPVVGAGVGLGAVAVTAWDLGDWIWWGIKLTLKIAYTIAMVIALGKIIKQIIEQLLPPKEEHLGMKIYTLFERACIHLGLNFKSDLLKNNNWVLIPSKSKDQKDRGVPNGQDFYNTFGDLIRNFKKIFNADYKITNGKFEFERRDYWQNYSNYVIPDVFTNQEELIDEYKPNTDEMVSNYNIHWSTDQEDRNTLYNLEGLVFQAITQPKTINDKKLVNIKGLNEIHIPCSLGVRKNGLTDVEKAVKGVAKLVDKVTGIFGGGTSFASQIQNRKGVLSVSSDNLTIPKVVIMQGSKLAKDQRKKLAARTLWDNFHYINSFAPVKGVNNQFLRYEAKKVPFCMEDFVNLMINNFCKTTKGEQAVIEHLKWKVWENTAEISYRVNKLYTKNLKIDYVE